MRKIATVLVALTSLTFLAGCGYKAVDVQATGATLVPGTSNLYRFCDGTTLIYFSQIPADNDQYEFIVYDGCTDKVPSQRGVQNLPDGN